ncbi:hypothetical protein Cch01nite_21110 [Cellulomonas chitinilytica]|uniref:Uncharacterized protein n=2 Tax=Cellulomonas chitinilytica TaxID=398759 RepID=A0A919P180_9CELL|nr:hypothetical protein Cch01nite_21110 [Cellulomonas chitinilytica]
MLALDEQVGPTAGAHGFEVTRPRFGSIDRRWVRRNAVGDVAVVEVAATAGPSEGDLRAFELWIAVTPEPALARLRQGQSESVVQALQHSASLGMYTAVLPPPGGEPTPGSGSWWKVPEADVAPEVAAGIAAELERTGWPTLTRLLDREALLAQVRSGDLGNRTTASPRVLAGAEAMLLADRGPSPRLDELIAMLDEGVDGRGRPYAGVATAFLRARAGERAPARARGARAWFRRRHKGARPAG